MAARILLVTFQQAMRSVVLTLFPISFIALIAWATAGSSSGNTSDPIRAAIWLWLGAHLVPFHLSLAPAFVSGSLSFLPIAAAVLPFLAIRSGFQRSAIFLENERAARSFVVLWYTLVATIAAAIVASPGVKPVLYLVPIYVGALSLLATTNFSAKFFEKFRILWFGLLTLFGSALILVAISLASHFKVVNDLAVVIQPGWVGGILFLLLQLLYLPNIAISTLSYLFGIGFAIGAHTQIDPLNFHLTSLPAIPILGALPTGKNPWFLSGALSLVAVLTINQLNIFRDIFDTKTRQLELIKIAIPSALMITLLTFLAGGGLVTKELNPIGPVWWKPTVLFLALQLALLVIGLYIPLLIKMIWKKRTAKLENVEI